MDSLFLLNDAGSFLLEKHYRGRVGRAACEPLLQQLQQHGSKALLTAPRILRSSDNCMLLHIHRDKLLLACACTAEAEPLLLLEMLQQLYELLRCCCSDGGPLTEDALRNNFSAVYVLVDLAVDFGYPFIMEDNLVQMLLQPSSVVAKAMQLVQGSSRVLTSLAASIGLGGQQQQQQQQNSASLPELTPGAGLGTGSGQGEGSGLSGSGSEHWWRRGAVTYASNEVYVDLIEKICGVVDSNGQMLNSSITGKVMVNCRLSGIPELCLSVRQPETLQYAAFHPCVRLQRFKRDGVLTLCPPDKEFCLASYWLRDKNFSLPVSVSGCVSFPRSSSSSGSSAAAAAAETSSGKLSLKLSAHNPAAIASAASSSSSSSKGAENISVQIPLPSFVGGATLTASVGSIRFVPSKQVIVWEVAALAFDSPTQTAEGTVTLVTDEALRQNVLSPQETRLVAQVNFLVKNWVPSGLKLDSLDVSGVAAQPYKGCRCGTVAGELEFRLNN